MARKLRLEFAGAIYHVISRGSYRKGLKKRYAATQEASGWRGPEVAELREEKWRQALARLMKKERKSPKDIAAEAKSIPWKVRIAKELRSTTTATNSWIAANLSMGHPTRVCNLIRDM